jgi:glycosyltransferase XagB
LTRQFTVEYATLFGLILPALAASNLPLALGGTSNHFRTHILRKAGGWDPHNVTEDADLGLRLARLGFRTGVVDSFTDEEANTQLVNWLGQRARWLKGFMQTWLVHMRHPLRTIRELGPTGFWTLQALTAGIFFSALFHPFLVALTLWFLIANPPHVSMPTMVLASLNLEVFVLGYGVAMLAGMKALRRAASRAGGLPLPPCHSTGSSCPSPRGSPCGNLFLRHSSGTRPNTDYRNFRTSDRCHPHQRRKACA